MQARLVSFIEVLRNHELRISTAETLDALAVADLLGYRERTLLRDGLSLALAKSAAEKTVFRSCFDRFFQNPLAAGSVEAAPDSPAAPAEPHAESPPSLDLEAEMAADPALRTQLDNPLLRMLQADDRGGLALAIAGAAQRAGLSGIQMFTQKGQYTRRILDELGEAQLRDAAQKAFGERVLFRRDRDALVGQAGAEDLTWRSLAVGDCGLRAQINAPLRPDRHQ